MKRELLWKRIIAVGLTAAMLMTGVFTGFADEAVEVTDEPFIENALAGVDMVDDSEVLNTAEEEEFSVEEELTEEVEVISVEDSSEDEVLEAVDIVDDGEEVLKAQDGDYDLDIEFSYGDYYSACLYTDKPLTLTILDYDTGSELELPDGYSLDWNIEYSLDGTNYDTPPAFITESYNEKKTQLTLTAQEAGFVENYNVSADVMLYDAENNQCGWAGSSIQVMKEYLQIDDFTGGVKYNWSMDDGNFVPKYADLNHRYSESPYGEWASFEITSIVASAPGILNVEWDDEENDGWNIHPQKDGESKLTITGISEAGEEISITCTITVSKEKYYLNLKRFPDKKEVIPGTVMEITPEISGGYYDDEGDYHPYQDFSDIEYQWFVIADTSTDVVDYTDMADGGIEIDTSSLLGWYGVTCIAKKNEEEVGEFRIEFTVSEDYYELVTEARLYDTETGEIGDVIDLKELPAGYTAVVKASMLHVTSEDPEGTEVENAVYKLRSFVGLGYYASFYEFDEETIGSPIPMSADGIYVALSGDCFAVTRNETSNYEWYVGAFVEDSSYLQCEERLNFNYIIEPDFYLDPSYGDEDELILYTDEPLTLQLADYDDSGIDFSKYDIEWSVTPVDSESVEDLIDCEEDGNKITLTVKDGWTDEMGEYFTVSAVVNSGMVQVGSVESEVNIRKAGAYPMILDYFEYYKGEPVLYVNRTTWIPKQINASIEGAHSENYDDIRVEIKDLQLYEGGLENDYLRIESDSMGWGFKGLGEGYTNLLLTYVDPLTGEDSEFIFGLNTIDNVDQYFLEVTPSKQNWHLLDQESVSFTYKVDAFHISGGVTTTIPSTAYKVVWEADPTEFGTITTVAGKPTLTAKLPAGYNFDEEGEPEIYVTASIYAADSGDYLGVTEEFDFTLCKEYYDVVCNVKSANGFTSLEHLPIGETATVTPVVKFYDNDHKNGMTISSNEIAFSSFWYDVNQLEVKTSAGVVIQPYRDDKIKTPYIMDF